MFYYTGYDTRDITFCCQVYYIYGGHGLMLALSVFSVEFKSIQRLQGETVKVRYLLQLLAWCISYCCITSYLKIEWVKLTLVISQFL